ncbi:MAG: riboflavin synthase [Clostridiales bacterium]|nr:riboflavin synthase [Clostridiales bacterium]
MFTGIIEEIGELKSINRSSNSAVLTIGAKTVLEDIHLGDSIAVNGLCLTVVRFDKNSFSADVMPESLKRSSLGSLKTGNLVNLERAMPANGRFGGHIVAGHIDGTGIISSIRKDSNAVWYTIKTEQSILKYIVEKGSVAIDGISLTVAEVGSDSFSVSVIPHTAENTILPTKRTGDMVNLENDCIGKYVEKLMSADNANGGITREYLAKFGF